MFHSCYLVFPIRYIHLFFSQDGLICLSQPEDKPELASLINKYMPVHKLIQVFCKFILKLLLCDSNWMHWNYVIGEKVDCINFGWSKLWQIISTISAGRKLSTVSAGRKLSTISAGRKLSTISAGRKLSTISAGRKLSTISAGRILYTISAGRKLSTISAGRKLSTISAGRKLIYHLLPMDCWNSPSWTASQCWKRSYLLNSF